jgi:hypothetical protein
LLVWPRLEVRRVARKMGLGKLRRRLLRKRTAGTAGAARRA